MPRTRTKYIWPPPILSSDAATPPPPRADALANISEPPAKKPRTDSPSRSQWTRNQQPASSLRRDSSPAHSDNIETIKQSAPDDGYALEWDPYSDDPAPPSLQDVFAAYARVPMDIQIKRYRDWRRLGSVHDGFCMRCQISGTNNLVPCFTCRRSFHHECIPPGAVYDERRHWFCAVCVRRNWHREPPTLTPPASPPSSNTTIARLSTEDNGSLGNQEQRNRTHISESQFNTTATGNPQALSILAEISRSMSRGQTEHGCPLAQSRQPSDLSTAYPPNTSVTTSISAQPTSALMSPHHNEPNMPAPSLSASSSNPNSHGLSMLDSHARKSRFATLSSEVDSALWVLYRELESVTSFRQRISELEAEIVKLRQDVSIRDNQIILSRRSLPPSNSLPGGVSQAEIDRLRVQAAKADEAMREVELVRANNDALKRELEDARAESAAKDKTLNEWKTRLASLIGT